MLRPATPLTVLLTAAFGLLLISIISTPIIKGIPLGSFLGVNFGVFGFCAPSGCSKIEVGYSTANIYSNDDNATFNLATKTRTAMSAILILHPVAAFFTLLMIILAGISHVHSPSHSARYLLGMFVLNMLTFLICLLSFLADVLLFVPHLAWGSYLVLAATALLAASTIISCAMRRIVMGRKAQRKRIAQNAEMNGENFYARQAKDHMATIPIVPPIVSGAPGGGNLPNFATYDLANRENGRTSDERIPLTARTPSDRSPINGARDDRYGGLPQMTGALPPVNVRPTGPPAGNEYGNVMPPQGAYVQPGLHRDLSQDRMRGGYGDGYRGRGGPPGGYRGRGGQGYGRGGFGPNMRGGYGPPGPGRGGMISPMTGGGMMRGGRGGPHGFGNGPYRGAPQVGYGPSGRRPGPYQSDGYDGFDGYSNDNRDSLPRAESPPPLPPGAFGAGVIGQAVELDASTGNLSPVHPPQSHGNQFNGVRDSDSDVAGMVGLQQQRANTEHHDTVISDTNRFDENSSYVPPRQEWTNGTGRSASLRSNPHSIIHRRASSGDNYYEDVDPRFADPVPPAQEPSIVPASLIPGYGGNHTNTQSSVPYRNLGYLHPSSYNPASAPEGNHSYEDTAAEGSRSPAESERSNFTSVSQRGINPRWNGGPGSISMAPPGGNGNLAPVNVSRRAVPPPASSVPAQRNDLLLDSNPDFELPGAGASRSARQGGRDFIGRRPLPPGASASGNNTVGAGIVPRNVYEGRAM